MLDSRIRAGHLNCSNDSRIRSAAADVTFERAADFELRRLWRLPQESDARQNHSGRAVAALHGVSIDERLLDRVQLTVLRQALDGGDLLASYSRRARHA